MSNKKLKIQNQKHQYVYSLYPSVAKKKKKVLSPQSSLLPLGFSVTKGSSFSLSSDSRHK